MIKFKTNFVVLLFNRDFYLKKIVKYIQQYIAKL